MPDSNRKQGIFYEIHVSLPLGIVIPLLACVPLQAAENMTEQSTPDESAATAENHEETMVITAAAEPAGAGRVDHHRRRDPQTSPPAMCRS